MVNLLGQRTSISITHKGKTFHTTVGSKVYEEQYCGLESPNNFNATVGFIPSGYAHRPDLMSSIFTGNSSSWWKICEFNNVFDQYEQMNVGDRVLLPS